MKIIAFIENEQVKKYIRFSILSLILLVIFTEFLSLIRMKAFWQDEWFIISSIKFFSYPDLFGVLEHTQQFPRVYLFIIKFLASLFNYNYFSLRIIPFLVQILNLFLLYCCLGTKLFSGNRLKSAFFIFLFLMYFTTVHYFFQVKQYTMEFLCIMLAFWQFSYLSSRQEKNYFKDFLVLIIFLTAPFFSYTYPVAAAPMAFIMIVNLQFNNKNYKFIMSGLAILLIAITGVFFIDIRKVLNDSVMKIYWAPLIADYSGLKAFFSHTLNSAYNFFSLPFFTRTESDSNKIALFINTVKILTVFVTVSGIVKESLSLFRQFNIIKKDNFSYSNIRCAFELCKLKKDFYSLYFLLFLIMIWLLFFIKFIPLGSGRLNYFTLPMLLYFFIKGFEFFLINKKKYLQLTGTFILILLLCSAGLFFIRRYVKELKEQNQYFDQILWQNVGSGIENAYKYNANICLIKQVTPHYHNLLIRTHPAYNKYHPKTIFIITNLSDIKYYSNYLKPNDHCSVIYRESNVLLPVSNMLSY